MGLDRDDIFSLIGYRRVEFLAMACSSLDDKYFKYVFTRSLIHIFYYCLYYIIIYKHLSRLSDCVWMCVFIVNINIIIIDIYG